MPSTEGAPFFNPFNASTLSVRQPPPQRLFNDLVPTNEDGGTPRCLSSTLLAAESTSAPDPRREFSSLSTSSHFSGPLLVAPKKDGSIPGVLSHASCFTLGAAFPFSPLCDSPSPPPSPPVSSNASVVSAKDTAPLFSDMGIWINGLGGRRNFCLHLERWCHDIFGDPWKNICFEDILSMLMEHPNLDKQLNACIQCEADIVELEHLVDQARAGLTATRKRKLRHRFHSFPERFQHLSINVKDAMPLSSKHDSRLVNGIGKTKSVWLAARRLIYILSKRKQSALAHGILVD